MRDQVQELFLSRTQRSTPSYRDWQTFLDLITYSFLLNRDAPIYTIYMGARNLRPILNSAVSSLETIRSLAGDRLLKSTSVDETALAAARRGLQKFGDAVSSRGINQYGIPPLDIFNNQTDRVTESLREGIGTDTSPEEAKTQIVSELSTFKELETELIAKTSLLVAGLSTYLDINLRGAGISSIVGRAERLMADVQGQSSPALKSTLEELIAIQSTVNQLATVTPPVAQIVVGNGNAAGTGAAAQMTCARSGPWDFEAAVSDNLKLDIDGTASPAVTLPPASKATAFTTAAQPYPAVPLPSGMGWKLSCLVSALPVPPAPAFTLRIRVDDGVAIDIPLPLYNAPVPAPFSPYLDYNDLTLALSVAGITVSSPSLGVLQVERDVLGETHGFRLSSSVVATVVSGSTDILGNIGLGNSGELLAPVAYQDQAYRGTSVTVPDVVQQIDDSTDRATPYRNLTEFVGGTYGYLSGPQQLSVYKIQDVAAGLQVTDGSRVVTSTAYNFLSKQVKVGDRIKFDGQTFGVTAVTESEITIDADHTSATGAYNFDVYPDTSGIAVDDMVDVYERTFLFSSTHRVASVVEGYINIVDSFFYDNITVEFSVYRDLLSLRSKKVDTDSSLEVLGTSTSNSEFSFAVGQVRGTVGSWGDSNVEFRDLAILPDDLLRIYADIRITSIGELLTLQTAITNNTTGAYSVVNPDREAHDVFQSYLASWRTSNLAYGRQIDQWLIPILFEDPRQDVVTQFQSKISNILVSYENLLDQIDGFSVRRLTDIDDVFAMLLEAGYDRARDLLVFADFQTFFELEAEEATYEGKFQLESQDFSHTFLEPDQFKDQTGTEMDEYALPEIESAELGTR